MIYIQYLMQVTKRRYTIVLCMHFISLQRSLAATGYLPHWISRTKAPLVSRVSLTNIRHGLKRYQEAMGLPPTGLLDRTTIERITQPRCGNKDPINHGLHKRKRRFKVHRGGRDKWDRKDLTYR